MIMIIHLKVCWIKFNKNMSLAKLSHIICHKYKLMGDLYDYSFYTLPKTVFQSTDVIMKMLITVQLI